MKFSLAQAVLGSAVFSAGVDASSAHQRLHRAHHRSAALHGHNHARAHSSAEIPSLQKRGTCAFPTDDPNLVAVTPDEANAGWAMSPDQKCKPGMYCPIACKPGMVMNQWNPDAKYTYPASMDGGLYCDNSGNVKKPFPGKPNCVPGTGSVKAINQCSGKISYCQTVLPGNEAMLIPTVVGSEATLAVPGTSYWESTAAHFYINAPGTGPADCVWGTSSKPIGNWASYVAGANTDGSGQTFVKLGANPVWEASPLKNTKPGFGVKVECPDGGCNGLPCEFDTDGKLKSSDGSVGAGGSSFCVVTVSKGKTAHIVAFDGSGGSSDSSDSTSDSEESTPSSSAAPSPPPPPTSSTPQPTSSAEPTTSAAPTTSSAEPSSTVQSSSESSSSSKESLPSLLPGIFHENGNSTGNATSSTGASPSPTLAYTSTPQPPQPSEKKGEAGRQQGSAAVAGLVVAFIAATCLF